MNMSDKTISQVIESYKQQGIALAKQYDFAETMTDHYYDLVVSGNCSKVSLIMYCRQLIKFYDLVQKLSSDLDCLGVEQDALESMLKKDAGN